MTNKPVVKRIKTFKKRFAMFTKLMKNHCCVPDMVLSVSRTKKYALFVCGQIYDKRHKKGKYG